MESDFREQYFYRRTVLLEDILRYTRDNGVKGKEFWKLKRDMVRFRLGESDLDIRIPFIFGGESEEIFDDAVRDLASLMKGRLEPAIVYDNHGGIMISVLDERVQLMPKGYRVPEGFGTRVEREIAKATLYGDPLIDAGLIASWFAPTLNGKRLIAELYRIYKKAIEEEMHLSGAERTSFLAHLAISKILTEKKEIIKTVKIRRITYEKLDRAISILLANIVRTVIAELLAVFKGKQLSYDFRPMEYLLLGTTTPFFTLNIKDSILTGDLNPYNLTPRIASQLEDIYHQAARKSHTIGNLANSMVDLVMQDKVLTESVFDFHSLSSFRDEIIDYLIAYDNQKEGINIILSEIAQDDKLLKSLWEDSKIASKVETGLADLMERYSRDELRTTKIRKIITNFKTHRKWGLIRIFSIGRETIVFKISDVVKRYIIYRLDLGYDSYFASARQTLENKKSDLRLKDLIREYEAGRLYRFSGDHKVFLVKTEQINEGHLFVDLKGFTRRTKRSGSLAMAEFLRSEFFLPILESAKRYYLKVGKEPSLGLELNNLLGDAISFSGNITALVDLAKEIRRICHDYKEKLVTNNMEFDEKAVREGLLSEYKRNISALAKEKTSIEDAIRQLEELIEAKRAISPDSMIDAQMTLFDERKRQYIDMITDISFKIKDASSNKERDVLLSQETELREQLSSIKMSQDAMVQEVDKQQLVKRSREFYEEVCRDESDQIERLRGMLFRTREKMREITQSYYDRLGEISDLGINTGLYISYGGISEVVRMSDDVWGNIRVSIADKINEASRGAQRNRSVKKRIDRFLEKRRLQQNNPDLIYPFQVIIGNTYSLIRPLDEEGDRFKNLVETLFSNKTDSFNNGGEAQNIELDAAAVAERSALMDDGFISESTDIYNLGEALSEEALREYIRESRGRLYFFERRIQKRDLNPEFRTIFAYDGTEMYLIFGVEKMTKGVEVEIFRYAGILDYAGTLKREVTEVYEILRPDSPFLHFIMKHHFQEWYEQSRTTTDVKEGLLGV